MPDSRVAGWRHVCQSQREAANQAEYGVMGLARMGLARGSNGRSQGAEFRETSLYIGYQMASKAQVPAQPQTEGFVYLALLLGWLIPGAGHIVTRHWVRALLLFLAITLMFSLGIAMQAKVYVPNTGDPLEMLGFCGDIGAGLLYFVARVLSLGQPTVQLVTADYGTKFVVVAGLLNFIAAVDAHNLRIGRKI